jgi:UDP-N-acetyl-D-glucosamine dehydrogenase
LVVAQRLLDLGAHVRAVDPHVIEEHVDSRVVHVELTAEELDAADVVVLLTDHDTFDLDAVQRRAGLVLDTRRRLVGPNVEYL